MTYIFPEALMRYFPLLYMTLVNYALMDYWLTELFDANARHQSAEGLLRHRLVIGGLKLLGDEIGDGV